MDAVECYMLYLCAISVNHRYKLDRNAFSYHSCLRRKNPHIRCGSVDGVCASRSTSEYRAYWNMSCVVLQSSSRFVASGSILSQTLRHQLICLKTPYLSRRGWMVGEQASIHRHCRHTRRAGKFKESGSESDRLNRNSNFSMPMCSRQCAFAIRFASSMPIFESVLRTSSA